MSTAKSPRMVPGAESDGFVAPIIFLPVVTTFLPSQIMATTGPEMMYSTNPLKNGFDDRSS